jgi:hypothetical protein
MGSDLSLLPSAGAVKCQASKQTVQKAAAAVTSLPALLAANPAFALVGAVLLLLGFFGWRRWDWAMQQLSQLICLLGQHSSVTSGVQNCV